jgi:hypothetical protein
VPSGIGQCRRLNDIECRIDGIDPRRDRWGHLLMIDLNLRRRCRTIDIVFEIRSGASGIIDIELNDKIVIGRYCDGEIVIIL